MIKFDQVTKLYSGNPSPALDNVTLEILKGEFVFLVGASGSGKSSFLRLVLKEEKPSRGQIHVLGQRLGALSSRKVPYFRRNLGVVFQDFRLLPNKNVFDNVAFSLQVIGKSKGFISEAVTDEPTGNLDPTTSAGIMALLERINQGGTTVLMATHDASIVNQMQRRVIELSNGTVLRDEQSGGYQTQAVPIQRGTVSNTTGIQTIPGLIR